MERVLIGETVLTAVVQKDLLATDVKQVRGNSVLFTVKSSKKNHLVLFLQKLSLWLFCLQIMEIAGNIY